MKQLSLLAAVLVVAACSEAPTAPGANATPQSDVAQVARRTAGLSQPDCGSDAYVKWTFLATVTAAAAGSSSGGMGGGTIVVPAPMAIGDATTATLEFCAVASTNGDTPFDLIVGPAGDFTGLAGTITVGTPANGATFTVVGTAPTYVLASSDYPSLPSTPGKFGTLILNNSWQLAFDLFVPPAVSANPLDKNACTKGHWSDFGFKNQGQCVRFVETGKDSRSLPTP